MKKLLTVGILGLLLSSCGAIKEECKGSDIEMGCNALFGIDPISREMAKQTDKQVKKLVEDVDLQGKLNDLIADKLNAIEIKQNLINNFINKILNEELSDDQRSALNSIIITLNSYGDRLDAIEGENLSESDLVTIREEIQTIVDGLGLVDGEVGEKGDKGDTGNVESTFTVGSDCVEIVKHGVNFDFILCN